ncbi:MAG: hypothetical protein SGBAC_010985 [Bacillariaceae sp.]
MLGNESESSEIIPERTEISSISGDEAGNIIGNNSMAKSTISDSQHKECTNSKNETNDDNNNSDSESEIEFLLTILPPSPKILAKAKPLADLQSAQPLASTESMASTFDTNNSKSIDIRHANCNPENAINVSSLSATQHRLNLFIESNDHRNIEDIEEQESKAAKPSTDHSMFRRSAYLQSLAEICHAILWDARWRVGPQQQRLMAWEKGDDLSVICTLAERYIPIAIPQPSSAKGASNKESPNIKVGGDEFNQTVTAKTPPTIGRAPSGVDLPSPSSSLPARAAATTSFPAVGHLDDSSVGERNIVSDFNFSSYHARTNIGGSKAEAYDRRLNLYCRLYYRKGPYFRVDDVFKYYRGKQSKTQPKNEVPFEPSTSSVTAAMTSKDATDESEKDERHCFFRPQKKRKGHKPLGNITKRGTKNTISDDTVLDMDILHRQLDEVCVLVEDWRALHEMGFLRKFADEEECGKTVGKPIKKGILNQEEQRQILQLLGCKKSQKSPDGQKTNSNSPTGSDNLVWKQMTHQTSISFNTASGMPRRRRGCVLPVMKHVNATILNSWAKSIVLKASKKDCISTANLRPLTMAVKAKLQNIVRLNVDLRANVDYLMMLRDVLRYNERKRLRQQNEGLNDEDNESVVESESGSVDFHDLLTRDGREKFLRKLCVDMEPKLLGIATLLENMENDVEKLEAGFARENSSKLHVECHKVLAVIAIIALHTLAACNIQMSEERLLLYETRPWLRHLSWEGCLAYILWDTIKTLECKLDGFYALAVKALDVLLFGHAVMPCELMDNTMHAARLMPLLVSRRAKGKAYERLSLNYLHHLRQKRQKEQQNEAMIRLKEGPKEELKTKKRNAKDHADRKKEPTPNELVASVNKALIAVCVKRAQIPFSAIRALARRLKSPLAKTLEGMKSPETVELGHRYSNDSNVSSSTLETGYSDWAPTIDHAVGNSISAEEGLAGKRCSYVGFEENSINIGSLNVEELAMEFYRTGRLPRVAPSVRRGGWVGWHDEGGKVRQLWRILSSSSVLGMDFGSIDSIRTLEMATIHLTPYQSAPFDLHCGAEMNVGMVARRGFYERRKHVIEAFLNHVASLMPFEVADLVYKSVQNRLLFASENPDPTLLRDIKQVRSVSLLAAGIGGPLLSAIFRCFFYDYRHYSGGLPDLTLIRALSEGGIVDLGEWVGEGFHPDNQKAENMLEDKDSEFLGCNKVGDSGGNHMRRKQRTTERSMDHQSRQEKLTMPPRLELSWNGSLVIVECMFSEVKSANDRLDARQEDWLNILDLHGNARVCKFGSKEK